jgi:hypothetical protein
VLKEEQFWRIYFILVRSKLKWDVVDESTTQLQQQQQQTNIEPTVTGKDLSLEEEIQGAIDACAFGSSSDTVDSDRKLFSMSAKELKLRRETYYDEILRSELR